MRYFINPVEVYRTVLVKDAYGQHREREEVPLWTGKASVQSFKVAEAPVERETNSEWITVYLPPQVEADSTMQLHYNGDFYQVEGMPEPWRFGALRHVKLTAVKVRL